MDTNIVNKKWELHCKKRDKLTLWGLRQGYIAPYDDKLIEKLRNIYSGGIPASIILLSNGMCNGHCYDRAQLMSRVFLDTQDDVKLVYASIDSLRLNPIYASKEEDSLYADHCIVERVTENGVEIIYDTSTGLIYDKQLYWIIERPKVRYIKDKNKIKEEVFEEEFYYPEDPDRDKYVLPLIFPFIEMSYGRPTEMYSRLGIELLQREIEHYKQIIDYDSVVLEIDEDMKRLGLIK